METTIMGYMREILGKTKLCSFAIIVLGNCRLICGGNLLMCELAQPEQNLPASHIRLRAL